MFPSVNPNVYVCTCVCAKGIQGHPLHCNHFPVCYSFLSGIHLNQTLIDLINRKRTHSMVGSKLTLTAQGNEGKPLLRNPQANTVYFIQYCAEVLGTTGFTALSKFK